MKMNSIAFDQIQNKWQAVGMTITLALFVIGWYGVPKFKEYIADGIPIIIIAMMVCVIMLAGASYRTNKKIMARGITEL